jgi:hypothetical protein
MKIKEILVESKKLDEAPMGMLSRAGRTVAATVGHSGSKGALKTGKTANQLKKDYLSHLGEIGEKASKENLVGFLKKQGFPTSAAEQALGNVKPTTGQKVGGALATVAKGAVGAVAGAVKGAVQGAKAATRKQPATESLNEQKLSSAAIDQAITAAVQQKTKEQPGSMSAGSTGQQTGTAERTRGRRSRSGAPNEPASQQAGTSPEAEKKVTLDEIKKIISGLIPEDKKKLVQHLEQTLPKKQEPDNKTPATGAPADPALTAQNQTQTSGNPETQKPLGEKLAS